MSSEPRDFPEPSRPSPPIGVFLILSRFQRGDYLTTGESPMDMLAEAWRLLYGTDPPPETTVDEIATEIQLAVDAMTPTPEPPAEEALEVPVDDTPPEVPRQRRARFAAEAAGILTPTGSRDDDSPATAGDLRRLYAQVAADHVQIMGHITESDRAVVQALAEGFVEADRHPRRMHEEDVRWLTQGLVLGTAGSVLLLSDEPFATFCALGLATWVVLWNSRWFRRRRHPKDSDAPS